MNIRNCLQVLMLSMLTVITVRAQRPSVTQYVDPRIGSEGQGRVYIGPCCPYGMVKPSPDCTVEPNSGWLPMPARVDGFAQTHVSGTGGGPKYGNILTMPDVPMPQHRSSETISLGYYTCLLQESEVKVEITSAERASFYRYSYPSSDVKMGVRFDLSFFLGRNPVPKAREAQQFEDSHLDVLNDSVQCGWQRISGGWNNGAPYTVYFYSVTRKQGRELLQKIGISFVSTDKARQNLEEDIPHWIFDRTKAECVQKWEDLLGRVQLAESTSAQYKRMFYTALYHTMLMPVDRTRDNGLYDDYYAIWDTYRTSTPLITLLDPQRATDIASSLLDIYVKDGFLPDARSGNSNGRTQGGSNAEIVFADAVAKGVQFRNKRLLMEAVLKDATVAPEDDEAEGRGGLAEYNRLGYIPFGIARGGNRTVEYSFCDWAIAQLAKRLLKGRESQRIYDEYMQKSNNWKNLWRKDYEQDGVRGFILPRGESGEWLDSVPYGHGKQQSLWFRYTPDISYEGPWYCPWWSCYFYEASSWEYSLSIPHDIEGLIEMCGGGKAFERRLDTFFDKGYYNVANEPSFLTPCLYHWIGKPERTADRVRRIVNDNYNDSPKGLPGNDDSGAMSSWLAFHMMGLYPNAGHDYYLIHTPLVDSLCIFLPNGRALSVKRIQADSCEAMFNGRRLDDWRITHRQLLEGGSLIVCDATRNYRFRYSLHGQTRRFMMSFTERDGNLVNNWSIERNQRMWHGQYIMTPHARMHAVQFCYDQPLDGSNITLDGNATFAILSVDAMARIRAEGKCRWANAEFVVQPDSPVSNEALGERLIHLKDPVEGAEMWVIDSDRLPIVVKMINNPAEINWEATVG